jgi:hypothetical protein
MSAEWLAGPDSKLSECTGVVVLVCLRQNHSLVLIGRCSEYCEVRRPTAVLRCVPPARPARAGATCG